MRPQEKTWQWKGIAADAVGHIKTIAVCPDYLHAALYILFLQSVN